MPCRKIWRLDSREQEFRLPDIQNPGLLQANFLAKVFTMSSAAEIEIAIRQLPTAEARAVAKWLQEYLGREVDQPTPLAGDAFTKWRGQGRLPAGRNTDDYLHLIRDGNGS